MQSDDKDSLSRLIEDVDKATESYFYDCGYFGSQRGGNGCSKCPAEDCNSSCMQAAFDDIARRLHALMPHDMDGREIKVGDTVKRVKSDLQIQVTDVMPLPVSIHNGTTGRLTVGVPHLWRVVEPDSWERLEADAAMYPHDYLTVKDTSDKRYGTEAMNAMAADLVRRAKALAGVGEQG